MALNPANFGRLLLGIGRHGLKDSFKIFYKTGELSYLESTCVGADSLGNKYYQAPSDAVFGRERFVIFSDPAFDASQVTAEWHSWMHYITDEIPTAEQLAKYQPGRVKVNYYPNLTSTPKAYSPDNSLSNSTYGAHKVEETLSSKNDHQYL